MHKKKRMILPFVPSEDGSRRLKQLASLATALTSSKTEFTNELTYMPNMAPRSSNLGRMEEVGGIQVSTYFQTVITIWCFVVLIFLSSTFKTLPKEDKECIEICKKEPNALHFSWSLIPRKGTFFNSIHLHIANLSI